MFHQDSHSFHQDKPFNLKDLFDANIFKHQEKIPQFFKFMAQLKDVIIQATPTPTHKFIKRLTEKGNLLRCYTQNIDALEKTIGLETNLDQPSNDDMNDSE